MIILGVILLIIAWLLQDAGIAVPGPIITLLHDGGFILIAIGIILLILGFLGVNIGPGIGRPRGNRRFYY